LYLVWHWLHQAAILLVMPADSAVISR